MSVVGDAWVVIRAITKSLNKDIKDGLDDAAKDAENAGDKAGAAYAKALGDTAAEDLKKSLADAIDEAADIADGRADRRGGGIGRKLASSLTSGLQAGLSGLASLTGMFAMVIGLGGLVGGLVGAVGALAAGAVALSGALAPGLVGALVVAGGALSGLVLAGGAALGIFSQLSKDASELGKNGRDVKETFSDLKDQFSELFKVVGEDSVFGPLHDVLHSISDELFPTIKTGVEGIGEALGGVLTKVGELFESPLFQADLAAMFESSATMVEHFGSGIVSLISAFASLMAAAEPLIARFSNWFSTWAEGLDVQAQAGQETGRLTGFLNRAGDVIAQVGDTLHNVWDVLKDVFTAAAPLGRVFLDNFQVAAAALSGVTSSAEGFAKITDFFKPGGQVHDNLSAVWQLVKQLGESVKELTQSDGIADLANGINRLLPGATKIIQSAVGAVGELAQSLANNVNTPAVRAGIEAVQRGFRDLGGAFAELGPALGPLLQIIGELGSNLAEVLGPAFAGISRTLPKLIEPLDQLGDALGRVLADAIEAILKLLPPLVEIIADLADAFAGPLGDALVLVADLLVPLLAVLNLLTPVFKALAPAITGVVIALVAMKAANAAGAWLTTLALRAASAVGAMQATSGAAAAAGGARGLGAFSAGARGVVTALGGPWGIALAAAVTGIIVYKSFVDKASETEERWAGKLLEGGEAAAQVYATHRDNKLVMSDNILQWLNLSASVEDAEKAQWELLAGMDPLTKSQVLLKQATNDYNYALEQGDQGDIAIATYKLRDATAANKTAMYEAAEEAGGYSAALQLVIDTLYGVQLAELAQVDARLATEDSIFRIADAQTRLNEIQADPEHTADQLARAQNDLSQAYNGASQNAITAAGQFASAATQAGIYKDTTEDQTAAVEAGMQAQVRALQRMADQAEGPTKDAILGVIATLTGMANYELDPPDVTVNTDPAISRLEQFATELGNYLGVDLPPVVPQVDNTRALLGIQDIITGLFQVDGTHSAADVSVRTDAALAPIGDVLNGLLEIDGTETTAEINAMVEQADNDINGIIKDMFLVDGQVATPEVQAQIDAAQAQLHTIVLQMLGLDTTTATPTAELDTENFGGKMGDALGGMAYLDGLTSVPGLDLEPSAFNEQYGIADADLTTLDGRVATPDATLDPALFNLLLANSNGALTDFDGRTGVPGASLEPGTFNSLLSDVNSALSTFAKRTGKPAASLDPNQFNNIHSLVNATLTTLGDRLVRPTVAINDQASGVLEGIRGRLAGIVSKTVNVVTNFLTGGNHAGGGLINQDEYSTVGEEGRELVFLSQGSYVATYQKAQKILAAASMQAAGLAGAGGGTTTLTPVPVAAPGGVTIPITVNPSAGMDELDLARKTGREFAFQYRKLT